MSSIQLCEKLAVFYIVIISFTGVLPDAFNSCIRYTSFGYGYRDFFKFQVANFPPNQVFYLEFYVKTGSDAHILLKPSKERDEGYEIVIGGGSNTFSQIRQISQEAKTTMITQKTENFLSPYNYEKFWISMDKVGIISVGNKDDEVFINWRFDDPLPVKVFSFGSWTNIKADWRFDCDDQKNSGSVEEAGAASPYLRLKHDLFTLYDPNVLPVEENKTMSVSIKFEMSKIDMNERKGVLTLNGFGVLKWIDNKIKWKPDDYSGIKTIYVPPFLIWTPSIRTLNGPGLEKSQVFDLAAAGVTVDYNGQVFWRAPFKSVSSCLIVDIRDWPNDEHNCTVVLGLWMEPPNLEISLATDSVEKMPEVTGKWKMTALIVFNTKEEYEDEEDDNFGVIHVRFKRTDGAHTAAFTICYIAAVVMSLISFWLSANNSLRLQLRCGSLLLLILTLFLLSEALPVMSEKIPYMMSLYSWTAVISCVPILLHVILKNIHQTVEVPQWVAKILSNSLLNWMFCLPELPQSMTEYANLNDGVNKLRVKRLMSLRLITLIERFFFLGYLLGLFLLQILV